MPEQQLPPYRKYNTQTNNYFTSGNIPKAKYCNGFLATNVGDTTVTINRKILFPSATPLVTQGDAVSFGGNEGEIFVGDIDISFAVAGSPFPVGVAPNIEIIQKYYIDKDSL